MQSGTLLFAVGLVFAGFAMLAIGVGISQTLVIPSGPSSNFYTPLFFISAVARLGGAYMVVVGAGIAVYGLIT